MKKLVIEKQGILYRNPRPGFKAECAFLPNVVALSDNELLCFYRLGQAFYSIDGKLAILRSTDAGLNWQQDGCVWDPVNDSIPYSYSAPHGTRLIDGTLLVIARRNDCSDPENVFFNPKTGGTQKCDIVLFQSNDNGKTWSDPETFDLPGDGCTDTPSQIIELNDGRWLLTCELWKAWDDQNPLHIKGFCLFSDDRGKTWKDRVDFPSASDKTKMYSHSRYTKMLDGRVCALQWTQEIGNNKDCDLHFVISDASAANWSRPEPTGILGQTSWVGDLGQGVLAAVYTSRDKVKPGTLVTVSLDQGKTWDTEDQVMLWDAIGQAYIGLAHRPSRDTSHSNIAFGKPNLARLADGSLICSWWCTHNCVTHTRFAKLRVE